MLNLDIDGIRDELDRDDWTPLMSAFAHEQLMIDNLHNGKFKEFLLSRDDLPPDIAELLS